MNIKFVYIIFLMLLLTGCVSHKEFASSERVRTEYIHQTDTFQSHDSIHVHDSIFVMQRGDTIFNYKYRTEYRDRFVYRNHNDTIVKTDTLLSTVYKTTEAKVSTFNRISMVIGDITIAIICALIICVVIRRVSFKS